MTWIALWNFAWKILSVHGSRAGSFMENTSDRRGIVNVYPGRGGTSFRAASDGWFVLASFVETTKRFYTCSLYNSKTFVYIPTTLREQYFYRVWKQCASVAERGSNGPPPIKLIIKQGKSSLIELTSKSNDASINREMLETRGISISIRALPFSIPLRFELVFRMGNIFVINSISRIFPYILESFKREKDRYHYLLHRSLLVKALNIRNYKLSWSSYDIR